MRRALALAGALVLGLTGVASAHVRLDKTSVPADSLQVLTIQVPGEEPAPASTTKVVLEVPAGFTARGCAERPGWTCTVTADTGSGRSGLITWTGSSTPKAVERFSFTVRTPNKDGSYRFEANQFYSSGEIAHWDQAAGEDHPSPVIAVTGATSKPVTNTAPPVGHSAPSTPSPVATVTAVPSAADDEDGGGAVVPVVLGVGVLAVGAVLLLVRARLARR